MPALTVSPAAPAVRAPGEPVSLRERKKRETARAIERAAVELAAEHPLTEVTVEAISAKADVTSRTFFNYFASKEDAVLGLSKAFPLPLVGPISRVDGEPVFDTVLAAVRAELQSFDFGTPELQARRRSVIVANPSLLVRDFQTMGDIEEAVAAQVVLLLVEDGTVPATERETRAWAIVSLLGAVLRLATRTWSQELTARRSLVDHLDDARRLVLEASRLRV